ncbi:DUF3040 domain-containing protein [Actinomycetota bacterium Odt1-20B]
MDDVRLSDHERLLLQGIEESLRQDRRLRRALRPSWGHVLSRVVRALSRVVRATVPESLRPSHPAVVAALGAASVALMVLGLITSRTEVVWAFALCWPLSAFLGFRLLCRWSSPPP